MKMLLAKSPARRVLSLETHSTDTESAGAEIFRLDGRWGRAWLRFFKLDVRDAEQFLLNLRVAGLFHDLGKANEDFQSMVTAGRGSQLPQTLRHEHISALVLALPAMRAWLSSNSALDVDVITGAVLSHHLKASDQDPWIWAKPRAPVPALRLYLQHPEVHSILARVQAIASLPEPPALPNESWSDNDPWRSAIAGGRRAAREFARALRGDASRRRLLLAVKAGLIVADSVASAVVRADEPLLGWIEDVVHRSEISSSDIATKIIAARTAQVSRRTGVPFEFHRFQTLCAEQGRRALLISGCGSGKTLAAWKWAESQARSESIGRVIFLYPTRGTATEGFRDYVGWAPGDESALLHGTATYELEAMMENPPESAEGKMLLPDESRARMFALEHWPKRFFSATVDQFLSFMEHSYSGLCLLPVLADSAVIFDEVHSYDRRMFEDLLAFLREFDVPVLCMTATLPSDRTQALVGAGLEPFPSEHHRIELADLERQETRPRYLVECASTTEGALCAAVEAYQAGQRVLWVVNTVARAQALADALSNAVGDQVLVYHSRFRLEDRKRAHERTVEAFQQTDLPALAVTTQVCEMSLDLDADMLITEIALVTALVQRFGRSNRSSSRPDSFRARALWYTPERAVPYSSEEIEAGRAFLTELTTLGEVSQRDLSVALERHTPPGRRSNGISAFLTGGYFATPGSLREETDYTVTSLLDSDIADYVRLRGRGTAEGLLVPVPKGHVSRYRDDASWPAGVPRHFGIASSIHYTPTRGFVAPAAGDA